MGHIARHHYRELPCIGGHPAVQGGLPREIMVGPGELDGGARRVGDHGHLAAGHLELALQDVDEVLGLLPFVPLLLLGDVPLVLA